MSARLFLVLVIISQFGLYPKQKYQTSFAAGQWDPQKWLLVKSPRFDYIGTWLQKDTYIENKVPKVKSPKLLQSHTYGPRTYTSMVYKKRFQLNCRISTTLSFAYRMAPLIVIAPVLGQDDKKRPEYREHYEVVLYDKGLVVWQHFYDSKTQKPHWRRLAYNRYKYQPRRKYKLQLTLKQKGLKKEIHIQTEKQKFGILHNKLPKNFFVGITACEGVNRFYSFSAREL
jgi:hypothetical protein